MNAYTVQKGDTIAFVTKRLGTDWQTLRTQNPDAIGKSNRNGNWFVREGANLAVDKGSFSAVLDDASKNTESAKRTAAPQPDKLTQYTVKPGDTVWGLAIKQFHVNPQDLIRDNNITDPELLEVGQKLEIRQIGPQPPAEVVASWYGEDYHGRAMANGDIYDMYANTIAHKDLPLGTRVELKNPRTGQTAVATITDRGPYVEGRDIDLSYGLASQLSLVENGVDTLEMEIL
ncbi:septal ring lytic transglycosylase RlpA family protein [Desulfopila sp. IMCC35006]|uniref:septal ring lytic transglycosylase RlpA family protein n=1 Tax=Desulfopila sp. IMCC35006 TaxID=2569542 RepID=UPI0010AC6A20|nr:septal ring lytic transglycosylase RlpA family protein [Desulfopila sp. IMCC35006]TKB28494.1 septal ring lytic transglycosylase RlpA family protein [Desulfopila sp. IMCC35006]